ncbi:MAG: TRAP transporter large permease [Planctomycetota bacterium]|jgi:tripartite ATP-independent transporter DctM subunit|nr:TRAP transporter large permease [Planctomycetota bacterium]
MALTFVAFLVLLVLGMPVAFAIGISGFCFFWFSDQIPMTITVQKALSTTQSFTMLAIPLFIFAGNLMNNTGITSRIMRLSNVLTGHLYGNIAQVSCVMSTLMGGVSGSAVADAAMESRILGPEMLRLGYSRGWSAGINGLSALIVATIPPSMGLIIYGSVGEVSIGRLFAAGFMPGIIMMICLMAAVSISARRRGYAPEKAKMARPGEIIRCCVECIWALLFPILLIFFIRYGIMTPSESGAFAIFYALFVGGFIYRELTLESFKKTLVDSVKDISAITIILAFSGIFGYGVVYDRLPQGIAQLMVGVTSNSNLMLLIIIIVLLIMGMFMETTVIALLMTPILLPVAKSVGVDPVHFGILMMTVVTFGVMTPPVGVALYTTSTIMECPPEETARESLSFYIAIVVVISLLVLFPAISLTVPDWIFGTARY